MKISFTCIHIYQGNNILNYPHKMIISSDLHLVVLQMYKILQIFYVKSADYKHILKLWKFLP